MIVYILFGESYLDPYPKNYIIGIYQNEIEALHEMCLRQEEIKSCREEGDAEDETFFRVEEWEVK
jgi:hypothetical protein